MIMKRLTQIFQALLGVVALILTALVATGRLACRTVRNRWGRSPKWLRRSVATLLVLVAVWFASNVGRAIYKEMYGRDYWDRNLSENISLHSFSDNKWRAYNTLTGEYTTGKINWVSDVSANDSLAVYALPCKRGYINVNTGLIVIDADENDYESAWMFSEGLAAVVKNGKIGFINSNNEVVIPFKFDYTDKFGTCDHAFLFHNGYCVMTNAKGSLGLIDKSGNWVVEPVYDEIGAPDDGGYRLIAKGDKYGVIASDGNVVYPAVYCNVNIIPGGFVLAKDGRQWQVDLQGNVVNTFMYDNTYYLKYPEGYNECGEIRFAFAGFVKYEIMGRYGIMNRFTGEVITPAIYLDINMLSKDLFEVQECDSYDWCLLDAEGNMCRW